MNASGEVRLVDQRDVQRRGGACGRAPVSCLIHDILAEAGIDPRGLTVLDTTYGEGRFYIAWRPRLLIGVDIQVPRTGWIVKPDIFIPHNIFTIDRLLDALPVPDIVVVDPPFGYWQRHRPHYHLFNYLARDIIDKAAGIAREYGVPLLVHYRDIVELDGLTLVHGVRFIYVTRYLNNENLGKTTFFGLYRPG